MARNDGKYKVPAELRQDYNLLVQKANRRIMQSLAYIQKENIKSEQFQRALVSDYYNKSTWISSKTVFSRSVVFKSKKEYDQKLRLLNRWASDKYNDDNGNFDVTLKIEEVRNNYYQNIIQSLTTLAMDTGNLDEKGKLPANLANRIKNLSTEQLIHFFDDDPSERIEGARWGSDDYEGADMEQFIDVTVGHIKALRKIYPKPRKPRSDKGKKRGPRKPKQK